MKSIFVILGIVLMSFSVFASDVEVIAPGVDLGVDSHGGARPMPVDEMSRVGVNGNGVNVSVDEMGRVDVNGNGANVRVDENGRVEVNGNGANLSINGENVMIRTEANNRFRLESNGMAALSSVSIGQEVVNGETKLQASLSNGRKAGIEIMPDYASDAALTRLNLKGCDEVSGCSIELKEVDSGEDLELAYELKTQRRAKVFGIFGTEMNVSAQVSAENGEVLAVNKPWWAFIASEPEE